MSSIDETGSQPQDPSASEVDDLVYAFEKEFRAGAGPRLEDHVQGDGAKRLLLLRSLVHSDLELRLRAGQSVRLHDYLTRFPELGDEPELLIPHLETELRIRESAGESVILEEYRALYGPMGLPIAPILKRLTSAPPSVPGYEVRDKIAEGGMGSSTGLARPLYGATWP